MLENILKRFQRGYTDVVGVDLGNIATKVVRLKKINDGVQILGADLLAPVAMMREPGQAPAVAGSLHLPKSLKARHVALTVSSPAAVIKLLTFPTHADKSPDSQVSELLGLGNVAEFRMAYEPVAGAPRGETRVLAVALPDAVAHAACGLFHSGIPAPCSIEISGLASLTAYRRGPGREHREECVAFMDFGGTGTLLAFINKGTVVMIRKFDFGVRDILKAIRDSLGVEADVALGILTEGSFDISAMLRQSLETFLQQVVISWDFVERRDNTRIEKLFVCGGAAGLRTWSEEIRKKTGIAPLFWNPFEAVRNGPEAVPAPLKGQESRFAGALGAALAMLGEI